MPRVRASCEANGVGKKLEDVSKHVSLVIETEGSRSKKLDLCGQRMTGSCMIRGSERGPGSTSSSTRFRTREA